MRSKTTLLLTGVLCTLLAACHSTDDTAMARSASGETYAAPAGTTPASSTAGTAGAATTATTATGNAMSSSAGSNMSNSAGSDMDQGQSSLNISSATVQSIDAVPRGMDQSSGDMQAGTSGTAGTTSGATGSMMYRVTLRLDDGTTRTFVQHTQPAFQIGDRVSVQRGVMQRY